MKSTTLNINEISTADFFHYRMDKKNISSLYNSVESQGILIPIWVCQLDTLITLDGFKRISAAQRSNITQIPALLISKQELEKSYIQILHIHSTTYQLSFIEKLKAHSIALQYLSTESSGKIGDYLQLKPIVGIDNILYSVLSLPKWWQFYSHRQNFSYRVLEKLVRFNFAEYEEWFQMAGTFDLNSFEIVKVFEQIYEICLRDKLDPRDLWNQLRFSKLVKDDLTRGQKVQRLKQKLLEYRMPVQTQIEKKLQNISRTISKEIGENLNISWDKTLEDSGIFLNLPLTDENTADRIFQQLVTHKIQQKIKRMIRTTKNYPKETP